VAKLPPPPPSLPPLRPSDVKVLSKGTVLWRIYYQGGSHPSAWNRFREYGPCDGRFDHHEVPKRVQARRILYGAEEWCTCFAEFFQGTRVIDRVRRAPWLVAFELTRKVTVLDLRGSWPTRVGASMAMSSGPRRRTRPWSQTIYREYAAIEGLWYASSMYKNSPAVSLYERAEDAVSARPLFHRALTDSALYPTVAWAALDLGYGIV
jgi:RES domain